jgi:hypothetical protein
VRLRQNLPEAALRRDEWYNDFLRKSGVDDAVGTRLFQSRTHTAVFGINHAIGQAPFSSRGGFDQRPLRVARVIVIGVTFPCFDERPRQAEQFDAPISSAMDAIASANRAASMTDCSAAGHRSGMSAAS